MAARWARQERAAFVDALTQVGPDAPTLCEGWTALDLAAHVYVRDRRPDAMPGVILGGPLHTWTERVMTSAKQVLGWEGLLVRIGAGTPGPLRIPAIDDLMNTSEFFIHTEDVRRANGLERREISPELDGALWSRSRRIARPAFRRVKGIEVVLEPTVGQSTIARHSPGAYGQERVVVRGTGGELTLLLFNRKDVAELEYDGPAAAIDAIKGTRLGL